MSSLLPAQKRQRFLDNHEMNSLSSVECNWVGAGPDGKVKVDGQSLDCSTLRNGIPYNIKLDASVPTSSFYFEIEVVELDGAIGVGVVKKEDFLPGWGTKGMFFNGTVHNGNAALIEDYGESPTMGDTVGVYVQREAQQVSVVFYMNSRCLGTAFVLNDVDPSEVFYPCLHVGYNALVKYSTPEAFPAVTSREKAIYHTTYIGDWKLEKANGPDQAEIKVPTDKDVVLTFEDYTGDACLIAEQRKASYTLIAKVENEVHITVKSLGKEGGFELIEAKELTSTHKLPPPPLDAVEEFLHKYMPNLTKMKVEGDELIMTGDDAKLVAKRHIKAIQPLSKY